MTADQPTPPLPPGFEVPEGAEVHYVRGNDAMSLMVDIWLSGFGSGVASGAANVLPEPPPADVMDRFARTIVGSLTADPLAIESIRQEVREIITGTGPDSRPPFTVANVNTPTD